MLSDELLEHLGGEQRRGSVEDEDVPSKTLQHRPGRGDRVSRTARLRLDRELCLVGKRERELVARGGRADDHEGIRLERLCGQERPVEDASTEERMEMLRPVGAHPRAQARRHDDRCEGPGHEGWSWLGREDSNLRSRDQNPLPYRLATPHRQ